MHTSTYICMEMYTFVEFTQRAYFVWSNNKPV